MHAILCMPVVARRAVLPLLLLAGVSGPAAADWVVVGRDEAGMTIYLDTATVVRSTGGTLKMWHLIDYKKAQAPNQARPVASINANIEYDCQGARVRSLFVSTHTGNMAGGDLVYLNSDTGDWGPVSPGSVEAILWKIACRKP